MSDKDINQMDFKELRNEVQLLRDELAIMRREYDDIFNNLQYELPIIDGKYTITKDLTLTGKVTWAMQNSPVKTQYSIDGETWYDEQIDGFSYMRMSFDGGQTWTNKTQVVGKDGKNGSNASVTFAKVNEVLGNLFKKASEVPTEITGSYIYSGELYGGSIYGCTIYAGTGQGSYAQMSETGLDVYIDGANKIGMGYTDGQYDYPYITLGAGTNTTGEGIGCIYKLASGLWIGDASVADVGGEYPGGETSATDISSSYPNATGIFIDLVKGKNYRYTKGVPKDLSVAVFG